MKTGRSLTDLAVELERQVKTKRDFIADTRELEMVPIVGTEVQIGIKGHGRFGIGTLGHEQIGSRLQIPKTYYDRMLAEAPDLLATNVNRWFETNPERRMVRTLDGRMRAFLSKKYRPLDNIDLAEAVLPSLSQLGTRVESCEVTDRRLYIKAVLPRIEGEVKKGDVVQAGVVVSNSEVGCGSIRIEPMLYRLVCLNGLISADTSLRKYHIGRNEEDGEGRNAREFYRSDTRKADDRAFWMKVQDVVAGALSRDGFERLLTQTREAAADRIEGDPAKVIEVFSDQNGLREEERGSVLRHLIEGGDLSRYGLMNAVTRMSQDVEEYDRATDYERLGGQVLVMSKTDWQNLN